MISRLAILLAVTASAAAFAADVCKVDTDCKGALPLIAKKCSNGSTEHLSWKCEAGACQAKGDCPSMPVLNTCKVDGDCKGALPEIARRCTDGGIDRMSWKCQAGACQVHGSCPTIYDPPTPT